MPPFFMNKRLIVLLLGIILLVALIGFSLRERENISWPEQFAKDMIGFGQNIVAKPAGYAQGLIGNVQDLTNAYTENQKLKSRLDELAQIEADVNNLTRDNEELRAILDIEEDLREFHVVNATVINGNPDQWQELITINKGQVNGIEPNMAVQTASGMIGRVKDVSQFTSTVELLSSSNPNNRVSALIQADETDEADDVTGTVEGYDPERKELMVKKIDSGEQVEVGSKVITSGMGGVFPKGILIGVVTEVSPDEYGLTQTAYVEPASSLYGMEHVMVVERIAAGQKDIDKDAETREAEEDEGEEEDE
ncbi:rod shape-determining protein MreC [Jeotgalibacillus marinus]|uniref:Cell shape-determining protein MreC n=1 Tax=Jeotgalibacillus marinus TaxID=86667 RepID=A0ABV3Q0D9_9BACL